MTTSTSSPQLPRLIEVLQKGVPLSVIQKMGAWESSEMVKKYAHLALEQFAKHAQVVDDMLNGTNLAQQE